MIDLHNHILPGLDDGAADLEESLAIARQFVSEGVHRVVATPHNDPERGTGASPEIIHERVRELRTALEEQQVPLDVLPGNELYLTPDALSIVQEERALSLAGSRAVLVEAAFHGRPLYLEEVLFRLQVAGYSPALAHPERSSFIQADPEIAQRLAQAGVVLQLTAPSLLGEYGPSVQRLSEKLLRKGVYALAASDRHHPGANRSLAELHARIQKLTDADTADGLLIDNPDRLLAGTPVLQ